MDDLHLAAPWWLLLLALSLVPWLWEGLRPRFGWPSLRQFAGVPHRRATLRRWLPTLLRSLAVICLVLALARPRTIDGRVRIAGRGVAILVAMDRSGSMEAEDFPVVPGGIGTITRLEAARRTVAGFVEGRPDDLIGLVAFARYPDLVSPPTLDHGFLTDVARALQPARPEEDGTNIGDAVAWALDALLKAPPREKVLVLLTDGRNQAEGIAPPPLDPLDAALIAREMGVTLHTIALGQGGILRVPEDLTGLDRPVGETEGPDLELLDAMARLGGGRRFMASDAAALESVFRAIDVLERSPVQGTIRTRYREWYPPWIGLAVVLLGVDRALAGSLIRRLP